MTHDLFNFCFETELQQLIGLIKYDHLEVFNTNTSGVHDEIDDSAWSGNNDFWVVSERLLLPLDRTTTNNQTHLQFSELVEFLKLLMDLNGQLSCRCDDQRSDVSDGCSVEVPLDDWQHEGCCFARTCDRTGNDVLA